jgi:sporulation protein YlmC with PRC-barrel domain
MTTFNTKGDKQLNVVSVRKLIDHNVVDIEEQNVGQVSDIIFEKANGMLAYVRIKLTDGRVLVVPYEAIQVGNLNESIKLRMYKDALHSYTTSENEL